MPMWHDENPYASSLVYVAIEDLAEMVAKGHATMGQGVAPDAGTEALLAKWSRYGNALDAYILPRGMSAGIRYGSEPSAYISPHVGNREAFEALLEKALAENAPPSPAP